MLETVFLLQDKEIKGNNLWHKKLLKSAKSAV